MNACSKNLRQALLDPAVNLLFHKMKDELNDTRDKLEQAQSELSAWKFTPDSQTGKKLLSRCRTLIAENKELGEQISQGKVAQLEAELALQKKFNEELKQSQDEVNEFVIQLDEEVEGMHSTIQMLQQKLINTQKELEHYKTIVEEQETFERERTPVSEYEDERTSQKDEEPHREDVLSRDAYENEASFDREEEDELKDEEISVESREECGSRSGSRSREHSRSREDSRSQEEYQEINKEDEFYQRRNSGDSTPTSENFNKDVENDMKSDNGDEFSVENSKTFEQSDASPKAFISSATPDNMPVDEMFFENCENTEDVTNIANERSKSASPVEDIESNDQTRTNGTERHEIIVQKQVPDHATKMNMTDHKSNGINGDLKQDITGTSDSEPDFTAQNGAPDEITSVQT